MRQGFTSTALAALLMASATPVCAQQAESARRFDIPAGPLARTLPAFARQSGQQILYPSALVADRASASLSGDYSVETALALLLRDTGLTYRRSRPNVFVLIDPSQRAEAEQLEAVQLDEVVVTGSLLRGVLDGPSPVVVVSRDQIDRDGHATVAQALAALPQNFAGTANDATLSNGGDRSGTNANYSNGVNLRGLGSDATLVLVNGRRIAGTGSKGDFADVSSIPTAAVERIDVLLDGASALYGADAVGGVINVVLRDDYDGAETRARYGTAADGAFSDVLFAQTIGRRWGSGSLMGVYEYQDREALPAAERDRAGDADLRRFGGSDRRLNYSNPGNIMVIDPASGAYVSAFAIPGGQDGTNLAPGDFLPGQENRTNQRFGMNVFPRQTRHIAYLAGRQDLGGRLTLSGDARWARRDYETRSSPIATLLTVNRNNPFFESPTGANSHLIAYSFAGQTPNPVQSGEVETLSATIGADLDLGGSWRLSSYLPAVAPERVAVGGGERLGQIALPRHEPLPHLADRRPLRLSGHAARPPRGGLRLDGPVAQRPGEALAPDLQVGLARIQPLALASQPAHRQMHVRVPSLVVQGEDIGEALAEGLGREGPGGVVQTHRIRPRRHAEHDRQGDRGVTPASRFHRELLGPVAGERMHLSAPVQPLPVRPFQSQGAIAADVVEVRLQVPEGHPGGGLKASGGGLAPQQDDVDAAVRRAVVPEGSADAFGCGPGLAPGPDAGFELGDDLVGDAGVEVGT